ncbi:MAG: hypothetical protein ACR2NP_09085 [Pirellulaceae bacterium]
MTSFHQQILAWCAVVCTVCITLLVAWFSWQVIASSLLPHTATSDSMEGKVTSDAATSDDQKRVPDRTRLPRRNDHRSEAVVVIADDEMARARMLESKQDGESTEQVVDTGNTGAASDRIEPAQSQQTRPQPRAPFPVRTARDPGTANPLFELSDEEKNRIWWEIAAVSERRGEVAYTYRLTTVTAGPLARKYGVSVLQIFDFFRAGVDATWLEHEPPELPIEDITDEEMQESGL